MYKSKQQVDNHVSTLLNRLKDEKDRSLRGFGIAKLYFGIKEFDVAKKYLALFLSVQDTYAPAHRLMGELLEASGRAPADLAKAINYYKRSYELDSQQKDLIKKICSLYSRSNFDRDQFQLWLDKADVHFPKDQVVFSFKEKLMSSDSNSSSSSSPGGVQNQLEQLLIGELAVRPEDAQLSLRLLQLYERTRSHDEAFKHVLAAFAHGHTALPQYKTHYDWHACASRLLQTLASRDGGALAWKLYLCELLTVANLALRCRGNGEAAGAVLRLDTALLDSLKCRAVTGDRECLTLEEVRREMEGQLYFCLSTLAYKKGSSALKRIAGALCIGSFSLAALQGDIIRGSSSLSSDGSAAEAALMHWLSKQSQYRRIQSGYLLLQYASSVENRHQLSKIKQQYCCRQGKTEIYQTLFAASGCLSGTKNENNDRSSDPAKAQPSFFVSESCFESLSVGNEPSLPTEETMAALVAQHGSVLADSLHDLVWLALQRYSPAAADRPQPNYLFLDDVLGGLRYGTMRLESGEPESLCKLDAEAFLYATVRTTTLRLEELRRASSVSQRACTSREGEAEEEWPWQLPALVAPDLCTHDQADWWHAVQQLCKASVGSAAQSPSRVDLARMRHVIQRGIETIRLLVPNSLNVRLIIHIGKTFEQRISELKAELFSGSSLQDRLMHLRLWADRYWSYALEILGRLRRNMTIKAVKDPLFVGYGGEPTGAQVEADYDDVRAFIASATAGDDVAAFGPNGTLSCETNDARQTSYMTAVSEQQADEESFDRAFANKDSPAHQAVNSTRVSTASQQRSWLQGAAERAIELQLRSLSLTFESRLKMIEAEQKVLADRTGIAIDELRAIKALVEDVKRDLQKQGAMQPPPPMVLQMLAPPPSLLQQTASGVPVGPAQQAYFGALPTAFGGPHMAATAASAVSQSTPQPFAPPLFNFVQQSTPIIPPHMQLGTYPHVEPSSGKVKGAAASRLAAQGGGFVAPPAAVTGRQDKVDDEEDDVNGEYYEDEEYVGYEDDEEQWQTEEEQQGAYYNDYEAGSEEQTDGGDKQLVQQWPYGADVGVEGKHTVTYKPKQPVAAAQAKPEHTLSGLLGAASSHATTSTPAKAEKGSGASRPMPLPGFFAQPSDKSGSGGMPPNVVLGKDLVSSESPSALLKMATASVPAAALVVQVPRNVGTSVLAAVSPKQALAASATLTPARPQLPLGSAVLLPSPVPLFGKGSANLAFASGTSLAFGGGSKLHLDVPTPASVITRTDEDNDDDGGDAAADSSGGQVHDPHFEPIIDLPPEIKVITGEEGESVLFEARAKLFRLANKEWKERGTGQVKILGGDNDDSSVQRARIVMRRDQTHKVCANHFILPGTELKSMGEGKTSWIWKAIDFSDGKNEETFAVRFKTEEIAAEFKKVFTENTVASLKPRSSSDAGIIKDTSNMATVAKPTSLSELFKPAAGSWECSGCLVVNKQAADRCVACNSRKPGMDAVNIAATSKAGVLPSSAPVTTVHSAGLFSWGLPPASSAIVQSTQPLVFGSSADGKQSSVQQPLLGTALFGKAAVASTFGVASSIPVAVTTSSLPVTTSSAVVAPALFGGGTAVAASTALPSLQKPIFGSVASASPLPTDKPLFGSLLPAASLSTQKPLFGTLPVSLPNALPATAQPSDAQPSSSAPPLSTALPANPSFAFSSTATASLPATAAARPSFSLIPRPVTTATSSLIGQLLSQPAPVPSKPASGGRAEPGAVKPSPFQGFTFGAVQTLSSAASATTISTSDKPLFSFGGAVPSAVFGTTPVSSAIFPSSVSKLESTVLASPALSLSKAVDGSGPQRSRAISDGDKSDPGNGSLEEYEPQVDFKPVIPLPALVEVKTGEEEEESLFSERTRLYRYDKPTSQWKERGVGELKVLKAKDKPQFRLVMRRDQILKLCANHLLTAETELKPMQGSEKAWCWFARDYSEGEVRDEQLAVKFKTEEMAQQFKTVVDKCRVSLTNKLFVGEDVPATLSQSAKAPASEASATVSTDSPVQASLADIFKPLVGNWTCDACYVSNTASDQRCACCQTLRAGSSATTSSSVAGQQPIKAEASSKQEKPPVNGGIKFGGQSVSLFGTASHLQQSTGAASGKEFVFGGGSRSSAPSSFGGFSFGLPNETSHSIPGQASALANSKPADKPAEPCSPVSKIKTTGEPSSPGLYVNEEGEDAHISFKPVIQLPDNIDLQTGEEDEDIIYVHRAKLFRFSNNEWKERGLGDVKLLRHRISGRVRIVMRREQILKLCLNHYIATSMDFMPMPGSNGKAFMWMAMDFSEGENAMQQFALRFKDTVMAEEFSKAFSDAKASQGSGNADRSSSKDTLVQGEGSTRATFLPAPKNQESKMPTVIFGSSPSHVSAADVFGSPRSHISAADVFGSPQSQPYATSKAFGSLFDATAVSPLAGLPATRIVDDDVVVVREDKPRVEQVQRARQFLLPDSFYLYESRPSCSGCVGCEERAEAYLDHLFRGTALSPSAAALTSSSAAAPLPQPTAPAAVPAAVVVAQESGQESRLEVDRGGDDCVANTLFSSPFAALSFSMLATQTPANKLFAGAAGNAGTSSGKGFQWAGAGSSLFGGGSKAAHKSHNESDAEDGDDPEQPHDEIHFKPVLDKLPDLIDTKTGEEDEAVEFCQRCKLYRFDRGTNQWKERGVGDIKLLRHNATGIVRVVMRRDQVLKLACNHKLSDDMELRPLATSDQAWCWYAMDYSEGELKSEQFAVRFKTAALASEFKKAFEHCQALISGPATAVPLSTQSAGARLHQSTLCCEPADSLRQSFSELESRLASEPQARTPSPPVNNVEASSGGEDSLFEKRCTASEELDDTHKPLGMGTLTIQRSTSASKSFYVSMATDDSQVLFEGTVPYKEKPARVNKKPSRYLSLLDSASTDGKPRRILLDFSSPAAVKELDSVFEDAANVST